MPGSSSTAKQLELSVPALRVAEICNRFDPCTTDSFTSSVSECLAILEGAISSTIAFVDHDELDPTERNVAHCVPVNGPPSLSGHLLVADPIGPSELDLVTSAAGFIGAMSLRRRTASAMGRKEGSTSVLEGMPASDGPSFGLDGGEATPDHLRLLDELVRQSTMGIARVGLDGRIQWSNQRLADLAGVSRDELIGMHVDDLAPPDDQTSRTASSKFISAAIANQTTSETFAKVIERPDGHHLHVDVTSRLVTDESTGAPQYFLSFVNDVSVRQELEQRQYQAEKMEAIGQMAGSIAHDINNMVGGILGYSEILMVRLDDETAREYCAVITDTALKVAQVTSQLLSVARQSPLRPEVVDVHELITAAMAAVDTDGPIEVDLRLDADHPQVHGERNQLQSVFENLISNARLAIAARPAGSHGTITVATDNQFTVADATTDTTDERQREFIRVLVTDDGVGMDAVTLRRAFEPYFTTHESQGAAGLGLAAAHATIINHAGTVSAESEPGEGTTFSIMLPVHSETTTTVTTDQAPTQSDETSPNIMIVDDDDVMRSFVVAALAQAGRHTIDFNSGHDAIAYFEQHYDQIQLAICDMVMPEMTGRELVRELRTRRPDLAVLMATGIDKNSPDPDLENLDAPVLQKPFRLAELTAAVNELLG